MAIETRTSGQKSGLREEGAEKLMSGYQSDISENTEIDFPLVPRRKRKFAETVEPHGHLVLSEIDGEERFVPC